MLSYETDPHYWGPNPLVVAWVTDQIKPDARVVEVGPGHIPFMRANEYVDCEEPEKFKFPDNDVKHRAFYKADLSSDPLPFTDKSIDFIYCRSTLEDMWNPFLLMQEMQRVAKAGYIETPSPFSELGRGMDTNTLKYRGYHHHRWLTWVDDDTIVFISKFSIIEYIDMDDALVENVLRLGPYYWNNYLMWNDTIKWKHLQCPQDYNIPKDYPNLLNDGCVASRVSTNKFYHRVFTDAVNQ